MFELNGVKYSNEQLQEAAVKYNMDFDSYLDTMKQKGLTEVDEQETYDTKKYSYEYDPSQGYFGETIDREITNIGTRGVNAFLKAIKGIGEYGVALEIGASDWYGKNIAKET